MIREANIRVIMSLRGLGLEFFGIVGPPFVRADYLVLFRWVAVVIATVSGPHLTHRNSVAWEHDTDSDCFATDAMCLVKKDLSSP